MMRSPRGWLPVLAMALVLVGCGTGPVASTPLPVITTSVPPRSATSTTHSAVPTSGLATSPSRTTATPAPPAASSAGPTRRTSPAPTSPAPPTNPPATDYSTYSNADLSWWYRPPASLGQNIPATIDPDVAHLISPHDVIWRRQTSAKVVHLTMDEGYEFETNSAEILDIAAAKDVRITFFITGSFLRNNPDIVRRMLREGHQVANHSEKHLRPSAALATSTQTFINEIRNLERSYQSMMGQPITRLFRPPEGGYSERSLQVADDLGYTTVFWSFAYADWDTDEQPDPTAAKNKILGQLHPGSVILLHAVSDTNVAILAEVIDGIRSRGYTIALLQV